MRRTNPKPTKRSNPPARSKGGKPSMPGKRGKWGKPPRSGKPPKWGKGPGSRKGPGSGKPPKWGKGPGTRPGAAARPGRAVQPKPAEIRSVPQRSAREKGKVAIVTCRVLPEPDPDQEILLQALSAAGVEAEMLAWDDRSRDPGEFGVCVLRSCWDYHRHPGSFLRWIDAAGAVTLLMNPPAVVRWNHHKRYLEEMQRKGVPVIPTVWFNRGEEADLGTIMATRKWTDVVVKPSVSASSFLTKRFGRSELDEGRAFLRENLRDRDMMAQAYMSSVEGEGEKAVVWIDGEFTHAVKKSPRFSGGEERVSEAVEISPEELEAARRALDLVRETILYARVDLVRGPGGAMVVSELELIEPSLFLAQHPPALARLAASIGRLAGG